MELAKIKKVFNQFPSPCGEKVENYTDSNTQSELTELYQASQVSVPLRGKGRKLRGGK